jgi:HEAT repeat protein
MLIKIASCCAVVALSLAFIAAAPAESQSIETLLAYLKSPNPETRRVAARNLGERRVRDQHAVEALTFAVRKDEDAPVRREALKALGLIKDPAAVPDMIAGLKDPDTDTRAAAARSLVSLYTEHDIDFITNKRAGWNWFNPFLETAGSEIVEPYVATDPQIITALGESARGDSDRDVRIAAIRALGVLRAKDAIPQLAEALNADRDVRIDALRTLIKIGDQSAGQHLAAFFRDSDQKVRTQAMVGAGLLKHKPAVEPLMSVYGLGPEKKSPLSKVARQIKGAFSYLPPRDEAALWALALIGDEKAEQIFVENMNDKDGDRRQYAFEGLARIGDPKYKDQISRIVLTEQNGDARLAEYWALYRMGSKPDLQNVVRKLDSFQQEQARSYLMESDPADLYPYLRSSNNTVKRGVIEILGRIGNEATIEQLKPIVQSSGAETTDLATVATKRIEWRLTGHPRGSDEVLQRESRPRKINP